MPCRKSFAVRTRLKNKCPLVPVTLKFEPDYLNSLRHSKTWQIKLKIHSFVFRSVDHQDVCGFRLSSVALQLQWGVAVVCTKLTFLNAGGCPFNWQQGLSSLVALIKSKVFQRVAWCVCVRALMSVRILPNQGVIIFWKESASPQF